MNLACRYCIYLVKFNVCLVTKPLGVFSSETKWLNFRGWIMWKMYNKTIIEFGFRVTSWIIKTSSLCYLPQPSASADNTDLGFDNSCYYSFKIFSRFWLVKTTRIIQHNQLLLAAVHQIWKESSPYWISDVKSGALQKLLNHWHQNVKSAARCKLLNRWPRKPGDKVVLYLVSRKTKSEMAKLL